jgi:hypothetical protein
MKPGLTSPELSTLLLRLSCLPFYGYANTWVLAQKRLLQRLTKNKQTHTPASLHGTERSFIFSIRYPLSGYLKEVRDVNDMMVQVQHIPLCNGDGNLNSQQLLPSFLRGDFSGRLFAFWYFLREHH